MNSNPTRRPRHWDRRALRAGFDRVRRRSEALAAGLLPEDQTIQSMPDVSPTKWHLAHTTWFFETFLLAPHFPGYRVFHPAFGYLFNSYYEAVGARHPRPERGLLSRPGVAEIARYRDHVSEAMRRLVDTAGTAAWAGIAPLLELGINHEEQHQELILMDIKHVFSANPQHPAYTPPRPAEHRLAPPLAWRGFAGGLHEIGHAGDGFAFDNEGPRHKVWLEPFRLASRLVTDGEYLAFIEDGGYRRPEFWLSDGWATVQNQGWEAPLYWQRGEAGEWAVFTLSGLARLDPAEPVCHVSFYEADATPNGRQAPTDRSGVGDRRRRGAARRQPRRSRPFHPRRRPPDGRLDQMIGDAWNGHASSYAPYPRYRARRRRWRVQREVHEQSDGAARRAAVTPAEHIRITYRNFFPPAARWAFAGLRLAEDA
jgi:ergothioneine biosynthesis protein EgtB